MSFTADMGKFCKQEAPAFLDKVVRRTVIEIGNRLVERSPVGDPRKWILPPPPGYVGGRFRANWQYAFGSKTDVFLDAIDASGQVSIGRVVSGVMANKTAGVHYIFNNLPYADRLENGYSSQAPLGIVGLVELEFPQIVRLAQQ